MLVWDQSAPKVSQNVRKAQGSFEHILFRLQTPRNGGHKHAFYVEFYHINLLLLKRVAANVIQFSRSLAQNEWRPADMFT